MAAEEKELDLNVHVDVGTRPWNHHIIHYCIIQGRVNEVISSFPHPIFTLTLVVSGAAPQPEHAGKAQRGRGLGQHVRLLLASCHKSAPTIRLMLLTLAVSISSLVACC